MYRLIAIIYLFLFVQNGYGSLKDRPMYGYHLRYGVPMAMKLRAAEMLRIIGGSPVTTATAIPHQAGIINLLTTGGASICGGSLISATRVVTAAHCWWDGESQTKQMTIVLGSLTIFNGGTRINTSNVRVHPHWNTNMLHDIALAVIPPVSFNNNIQVIPLPTIAEVNLSFAGSTGTISGFGKMSDAQIGFPLTTALHHTTVTVITNDVCQRSYPVNTAPIHGSHICVSGEQGRGSCDGDSGGPLTVIHNNRRILVGVVSFGHSAGCQAHMPSVFTRVSAYIGWLQFEM